MKTVTPEFLAAVASSHSVALQVDAYYDGELVYEDLPISEGSVTLTRTDMVRAKLSARVSDPTGALVPRTSGAPLNVYGQELHVRAGVAWPTSTEMVSLGWFRVQSFKADERWTLHPNGQDWVRSGSDIYVEGMDRMAKVVDARFTYQSQPAGGSTCLSEIARLVTGIVPMGVTDPRVSNMLAPAGLVYEEDRAEAIAKLAASINAYCYVDGDGDLRVTHTTPVDTGLVVGAGLEGVAVSIDSTNTRDEVYNAIVARGEDSSSIAPYWAVEYDLDPTSPTRWGGPFGYVTGFFSSPFITTQNAANLSARTRLTNLKKDLEQQFTIEIIPNPAIEPDDVFTLVLPSQAEVKVKVIEATIPLASASTMSLTVSASKRALEEALADDLYGEV